MGNDISSQSHRIGEGGREGHSVVLDSKQEGPVYTDERTFKRNQHMMLGVRSRRGISQSGAFLKRLQDSGHVVWATVTALLPRGQLVLRMIVAVLIVLLVIVTESSIHIDVRKLILSRHAVPLLLLDATGMWWCV